MKTLEVVFPGSPHVRLVGPRDADDAVIWNFARDRGFIIVSKDSNFHQQSFLLGFPPKVIWIWLGNCPTKDIGELLQKRQSGIVEFCKDEAHAFLALS